MRPRTYKPPVLIGCRSHNSFRLREMPGISSLTWNAYRARLSLQPEILIRLDSP